MTQPNSDAWRRLRVADDDQHGSWLVGEPARLGGEHGSWLVGEPARWLGGEPA